MVLKSVLLDFWGTTFFPENISEYRERRLRDVRRVLRKYGYRITEAKLQRVYSENRAMIDKIRKYTLREITLEGEVIAFLDRLNIEFNSNMVRDLCRAYIRVYYKYTKPLDGLEDFLHFLKDENIKVAIVSNTMHGKATKYLIRKHGLSKFFDALVMSDEVSYRKPHSKIFRFALRKLNVSPKYAVMVGDEKDDVYGAKKVGLKAILFTYVSGNKRYGYEDHIVGSFEELKELLKKRYI